MLSYEYTSYCGAYYNCVTYNKGAVITNKNIIKKIGYCLIFNSDYLKIIWYNMNKSKSFY